MVAEARLTRTGVFTYRNADGLSRREYRPPTEVHDSKSLASFRMVPLTNGHPPTMITAQNARQYAVGAVGENVRRDGDFVVAPIAVHDAATIAAMDAGKTQVSCGYDCDLVETPGVTPNGEHYDAMQTHIVGNHLAVAIDNARAGKDAAVRMDAMYMDASAIEYDNDLTAESRNKIPAHEFAAGDKLPIENPEHVRAAMSRFSQTHFESPAEKKAAFHKIVAAAKKFGISSDGFEAAHRTDAATTHRQDSYMNLEQALAALATAQQELGAAKARADKSDADLGDARKRADAATAERDAAKEAKVAADKARTDAEAAQPARIKARVALEANAARILPRTDALEGVETDRSGLTDRALKCAIIKHVTDADVGADRSEDYVNARYDAAVERAAESADTFRQANNVIESHRADTLERGQAKTDKARQDMIESNRNAWRHGAAPTTASK